MSGMGLILSEKDEARLTTLLSKLCIAARGRAALLIDPHGRVLTAAGETAGADVTSLAALTAGSLAAAGSLARLVGENEVRAITTREEDRICISGWLPRGRSWWCISIAGHP